MQKPSPLQRVRDEHGSKEELAEKVIEILDVPEDEDPLDFEERLKTASNKKLLKLWDAHQHIQDEWGSKEELVEAATNARFPGGNEDYAAKISTYSPARLLDVARQNGAR